jgi:hypothetical protein
MEPDVATPPRWYMIVSALAFLWTLFGVAAFVMDVTMSAAALAEMPEAQRQLFEARPAWIVAVYAVAVFSGVAGAAGLLLRRRWVVSVLALSLAAIVVQFGYVFIVMDAIAQIGAAAAVPLPAAVFFIAAGLLRFAVVAARRGWLVASRKAETWAAVAH